MDLEKYDEREPKNQMELKNVRIGMWFWITDTDYEYENDWRVNRSSNYTKFKNYGDPGPGDLAKITRYMPRVGKCIFKWTRERRNYLYYDSDRVPASVTILSKHLLNVEAYTPGDYHIFFDDFRTREQYIKWAPLLLAAEDYHAGKLDVNGEFK